MLRWILGPVLAAFALGYLVSPALATKFTVVSHGDLVDTNPGDGVCASDGYGCTLRAAVQEANALPGPDEIDLPTLDFGYGLWLTGANEDAAASGDLDVTSDITIVGASARRVRISGLAGSDSSGIDRILDVLPSGRLSLSKVTLEDGAADQGGIIRAAGPLALSDVMIENGSASSGGGISATAPVSLDRVTVANNRAMDSSGGGIATSSALTAVNSTVYDNSSNGDGGGIAVLGGTADLTNVTLSGNYANNGSANTGSGNTAFGGQLYNSGVTQVRNSLLERRFPSGPNCGGAAITSGGHNVDDDGSCAFGGAGDRFVDFSLWNGYGVLVDAGGWTDVIPTFSWPGGPARPGPGVDIGAENCPATDQRGVTRPQGMSCDAGAYEAEFADLALTANGVPTQIAPGAALSFSLTVHNYGPMPAVPFVGYQGSPAINETRAGAACIPYGCIGVLAPGETATIDVSGTAPDAGQMSYSFLVNDIAPVRDAALDPNEANSWAVLRIPVVSPAPPPSTPPESAQPTKTLGRCSEKKIGTAKADRLVGTPAGDLIKGLGGNDRLLGKGGDDCLEGGRGNDKLIGGPGRDRLSGGPGNDTIDAVDKQRDTVSCGKGRDRAVVDPVDRVRGCEKVTGKRRGGPRERLR